MGLKSAAPEASSLTMSAPKRSSLTKVSNSPARVGCAIGAAGTAGAGTISGAEGWRSRSGPVLACGASAAGAGAICAATGIALKTVIATMAEANNRRRITHFGTVRVID